MPETTYRLLLVEDDQFVAALTAAILRDQFSVTIAGSSKEARAALTRSVPDLILLDLGLPDEDGLVLARQLIAGAAAPPIIYLTSRDCPRDIVVGLEMGGIDYITKPFEPDVLLARIRAALRRTGAVGLDVRRVSVGRGNDRLELDLERRRVEMVSGDEVRLTRAEFDILRALVGAQGRILTRGHLLDAIADGPDHDAGERVVDALVSRIRRKLVVAGLTRTPIETVRGLGYRADIG